jgi:hypothetical protein
MIIHNRPNIQEFCLTQPLVVIHPLLDVGPALLKQGSDLFLASVMAGAPLAITTTTQDPAP